MSPVDLHYRRLGKEGAQAVVILHGLFGTSDNWGSIGRELAEQRSRDRRRFRW